MQTKNPPRLIELGSAEAHTRADVTGEKMELNPIFRYTDAAARAFELGSAAEQTRADAPSGNRELIPVERWTV